MRARPLLALLALASATAAVALLPSASARRSDRFAARAVSPSDVTQGKNLYGHFCSSCHGANGMGIETPRQIGAAALRDQTVQNGIGPSLRGVGAQAADFYLRTGYMPLAHTGEQPHRTRVLLEEQQIKQLTAYVASLAPGPAIPDPQPSLGNLSQGQHLFTDHCGGCHQIAAAGGYVTGAVPPSLRHASAVQVAEAVRIGPSVMPRFSRKAISDRELDSIIAYVQFTKHPADPGGWAIGRIGPVPEGLVTWFIALAALVAICVVIGRRLKE
jgi:ubiquinol-cytochrome c reductase cytochrome c subunit